MNCKQIISPPAKAGDEIGGEGFMVTERERIKGGENFLIGKLFEIIRKANDLGIAGKQITEIRLFQDKALPFENHILEIDWKREV